MPLDYTSSSLNLSLPEPTGPLLIEYPFSQYGDLTSIVATQEYMQDWTAYTAPTLSTTITVGAATLYLTGDDKPTDAGAGVCRFTRTWMSIPASRIVPVGTYSFGFPGLPAGTAPGSPTTITAMSPTEADTPVISSPVFTVASHPFAVGNMVQLVIVYTSRTVTRTATVTAFTATTFTTTGFQLFVGENDFGSFVSGTAVKYATSRNPKSIITDSAESFSYALPGVTTGITTAGDFRPEPLFQPIVTATAAETDTLASTTTPTDTAYRASVADGEFLVAESGIRRLAGEILERRTLNVRYQ